MQAARWLLIFGLLSGTTGFCQSTQQPLGDVARASREAPKRKAARVITEDDLATSNSVPSGTQDPEYVNADPAPARNRSALTKDTLSLAEYEVRAEVLKSTAMSQKARVRASAAKLDRLKMIAARTSPSRRAGVCQSSLYTSYKEWCDKPQALADHIEVTELELSREQAALKELQDQIRAQGYGAQIYDPE